MIYNEPALLRFAGKAVPKPDPAALMKAIESYAQEAAAAGLTALHEPGTVKPEWIEMLARLSNTLPVRLSASFSTDMIEASKPFAALGPSSRARHVPNSRLSLYGMKYWGDGSNQAETAAQTQPYLNTDQRGSLGYTAETASASAPRQRKRVDDPGSFPGRCSHRPGARRHRGRLRRQFPDGAQPHRTRHHGAPRPDRADEKARMRAKLHDGFHLSLWCGLPRQPLRAGAWRVHVPGRRGGEGRHRYSLHTDNRPPGCRSTPCASCRPR